MVAAFITHMPNKNLFTNGGGMGWLMQNHAWAETPLGAPEKWSVPLRTLVSVMLGSNQPMFIAWGDERILLYNDAYSEILGKKHPDALGKPFEVVWEEAWVDIEPIMTRTYLGTPTHMDDITLMIDRKGQIEETHFAFSYTPVRDESGKVTGMFCACTETTDKISADRRMAQETARIRTLFQKAPGFITILKEPTHIFEFVNDSYMELVGHRDILGLPVREALPEVQGQGFFELLDKVFETGEAFHGRGMQVFLQRTADSEPVERYKSRSGIKRK